MGSSDTDKPAKESKTPPPPSTQEHSSGTSTATVNPEWPGFQAYSPIPPHGFLASTPQAHPYMWGVQHIMPPYGAPPHPYVAMYPHGGIYAHPSMPPGSYPFGPFAMPPNGVTEASSNALGSADADSKPAEGKEKLPIKRSKGSLGSMNMIKGKGNEESKTGPSANVASSKSAESASDASSEGSDEDSQNDSPAKSGGRQDASEAEPCQNGSSAHVAWNGVPNAAHTMVNHAIPIMAMTTSGDPTPVPGPTTNLNIGMDYWGPPAMSNMPTIRGKVPSGQVAAGMIPAGSRDNLQSQHWLQDERELKRQRRKQSNRESARRSRLRKQAECDELAQRADALKEENVNLRSELNRFRNEYEKIVAENAKLKVLYLQERLVEVPEELGSSRPAVTETQEGSKADEVQNDP